MKINKWLGRALIGFGISALAIVITAPESRAKSPEATTTTLTTSLNPSVYGQAVPSCGQADPSRIFPLPIDSLRSRAHRLAPV
jgi:hypothetical protein